ncbi:MAG TPA: tRNA uridine-5-carboxymethylaminomethyl(34) synthesis GTPase MnmE [Chromatiales bacterium]|nr:tRNA uridine-5-carboxymethylaminomethyl(34) synthesis GTPase MnmE [Chromatiales bacterium]
MQALPDTIVARATPPGRGGIAVLRVSGPGCRTIAESVTGSVPAPRRAVLRDISDSEGQTIDTALVLFFPAPGSFTGEDVLEFQLHGSPVICELVLGRIQQLGARLAEPGEFTRRAFLNDRLDLNQAEAVADLIDAGSRAAALAARRSLQGDFSAAVLALNDQVTELRTYVEAAIDFPDEDIDFLDDDALRKRQQSVAEAFDRLQATARQGVLLRDGIQVVIAGRPNAGKSSLLNALAGYDAAIVTEVPGTTRDLVRESIDLDGLPLHVIDTAGLRSDPGRIEAEGIRRAREQLACADHALLVVDATSPVDETTDALIAELPPGLTWTVAVNKIDLSGDTPGVAGPDRVNVSALTGAGLDQLRTRVKSAVGYEEPGEGTVIARQRHLDALHRARKHFEEARRLLDEQQAGELFADELLQVQNALAEITGEYGAEDLLGEIFSNFCIGK